MQRYHWYVKLVGNGAPDHVPLCAFSTSPTDAVPEIVGATATPGGDPTNVVLEAE